jgi:hypothetical protein
MPCFLGFYAGKSHNLIRQGFFHEDLDFFLNTVSKLFLASRKCAKNIDKNPRKYESAGVFNGRVSASGQRGAHVQVKANSIYLKALTDHLGGGSRVYSFDPYC